MHLIIFVNIAHLRFFCMDLRTNVHVHTDKKNTCIITPLETLDFEFQKINFTNQKVFFKWSTGVLPEVLVHAGLYRGAIWVCSHLVRVAPRAAQTTQLFHPHGLEPVRPGGEMPQCTQTRCTAAYHCHAQPHRFDRTTKTTRYTSNLGAEI